MPPLPTGPADENPADGECSPYRAIEPRGETCVSDVGRLPRVTGRTYGSTLFHVPQSRRGIVLDSLLPAQARVRGAPSPRSWGQVRGGNLWASAYRGVPEQLVSALQQGMLSQEVPHAQLLPQAALPEWPVESGVNGATR